MMYVHAVDCMHVHTALVKLHWGGETYFGYTMELKYINAFVSNHMQFYELRGLQL